MLVQGKYEAAEAKFNSSFHWSFPAVQKLHGKRGMGESTNSWVVSLVEAASPDSLHMEKESRTGKAHELGGSLKGSPEALGTFLQHSVFFSNSLDLFLFVPARRQYCRKSAHCNGCYYNGGLQQPRLLKWCPGGVATQCYLVLPSSENFAVVKF